MENIIEIKGLNKSFGNVHAVNDLSFNVKKGDLFAFLGINGAGKSTTISMICGTLTPDGGEIKIDGTSFKENSEQIKRDLGVVFQNSVLDSALSVYDNLESRAALYGITGKKFAERLNELADLLDFKALLKRQVGKLSGGQRRRVDIARALIHKPKILILDEPTTGLDPQTRKLLWNVVSNLQKDTGITVFLTTHYMEEAAAADFVTIIDQGKIIAEGSPLTLKNTYTGDYITLYGVSEQEIKKLGKPYTNYSEAFRIEVENTAEATSLIIAHPEIFNDYEITKGNMDDVFLAATGKILGGETK